MAAEEEMIGTTKGMLKLADLRVEKLEEDVPCGKCYTTSYYLGEELVRRDIDVHPSEIVLRGMLGQL